MSAGNTLTCPNCGNEEPIGARFCGNCSAPLAPPGPEAAHAVTDGATTSKCASCANEEPAGTQFCGNCGAPFAPLDREPAAAHAASLEPGTPEPATGPDPADRRPSLVGHPAAAPPEAAKRRMTWIAAGAAVVLLVAGGAVAVLLVLPGSDPTPVPPTKPDPRPPAPSPTLAERIAPSLRVLTASQDALDDRLRSLTAGVESFAALRGAAASTAASVVQTEQVVDGLAPDDAADAEALTLLRRALAAHLAYADALSSFPPLPRSLTATQARAAIARAEEAQLAYAKLAFADPSLPSIFVSTAGNPRLLAVVPPPEPTPSAPVRRVVDLVPLLVGIGPDDPPNEGRCFGPYTSRASLRVSGVVHRTGFIQCGDDANGDPSRASGVYRFSGPRFPAGSKLARLTGQVAIDESSSPTQRGSAVTWAAFYDGTPICSVTVVWSGSRPSPKTLDCRISPSVSAGGFDVRRLRIEQVVSRASSGSLWAGLLGPAVRVEVPR
jgi:Double zinc ribbon